MPGQASTHHRCSGNEAMWQTEEASLQEGWTPETAGLELCGSSHRHIWCQLNARASFCPSPTLSSEHWGFTWEGGPGGSCLTWSSPLSLPVWLSGH